MSPKLPFRPPTPDEMLVLMAAHKLGSPTVADIHGYARAEFPDVPTAAVAAALTELHNLGVIVPSLAAAARPMLHWQLHPASGTAFYAVAAAAYNAIHAHNTKAPARR